MSDLLRLSKREWDALGRLMMPPEYGGKFTVAPKIAAKLLDLGFIRPEERRFYGSGNGAIDHIPVVVTGYSQTLAGNMAFCEWAARQGGEG